VRTTVNTPCGTTRTPALNTGSSVVRDASGPALGRGPTAAPSNERAGITVTLVRLDFRPVSTGLFVSPGRRVDSGNRVR